jgi:hypothetical protein
MRPLAMSMLAALGALLVAPAAARAGDALRLDEPASPRPEPPALTLGRTGPPPRATRPNLHPNVPFLDAEGESVLRSGRPLSLMRSCGACHDTAFIAEHNFHALVGLDEPARPGETGRGRSWDTSPGLYGRWDPLTYRRLSPPGDPRPDLGTADWIRAFGARHVGGGPAARGRDGQPLGSRPPGAGWDPETHAVDPASGEVRVWDWQASGTVELDCLLCHAREPDNQARLEALRAGRFAWASTATLVRTGLVHAHDDRLGHVWEAGAFEPDGTVQASRLGLGRAPSDNCRLCHGRACRCTDPVLFENSLENWSAETTGTIFSPSRMRLSGMNLEGKEGLSSPWDVHAERRLACGDCHHAPNNPAFDRKRPEAARPLAHLAFDARRASLRDYLWRPDHNLAKGHTSQGTAARRLDGSMRDCRDCHQAELVHEFLPFKRTHFARLACEACHIPRLMSPARMATDWTLLDSERRPRVTHRGVQGAVNDPASLVTGFEPALLPHETMDGEQRLQPHNLISAWFWVEGEPPRPVRLIDLERALFEGPGHHPDVLAALDRDGDGRLGPDELRLDTPSKAAAVATRLQAIGLRAPRIQAELQPYTIGHGVPSAREALRDCTACHGPDGRVGRTLELADFAPGGVLPRPVNDASADLAGEIALGPDGRVEFRAAGRPGGIYVHGAQGFGLLDLMGLVLVAGTFLGVLLHGGLRVLSRRRRECGGR